jgi:hypothetical protein
MTEFATICFVLFTILGYVYTAEKIKRCYIHKIAKQQKTLKSFQYKNVWYNVTVQAYDVDHACELVNIIFKQKKQPLRCFADQLKIVE